MNNVMLQQLSIRKLYTLALAEGEGVGTAYEYFVKRLLLRRWLQTIPHPRSLLVAGLPEKYGCSLDFLLLAQELRIRPMVVDDRPIALAKLQQSVQEAQRAGMLLSAEWDGVVTSSLPTIPELKKSFDLVICSEVVQRLFPPQRYTYFGRLMQLAPHCAIFCPNSHNAAHTTTSGLKGVSVDELRQLATHRHSYPIYQTGYVDMPPFPPGITRTEDQRTQATSGLAEQIAMSGLEWYARGEKILPQRLRAQEAHIVYLLGSR